MQQTGTKRKRVGEQGDWEYECTCCEKWLDKKRFGGCVNYVDAYGNCLICASCRSRSTKQKIMDEDKASAKRILEAIGFYKHKNTEAWLKASIKKNKA